MVEARQSEDRSFAILAFSCTERGGQVATGVLSAYAGGHIRRGQDCLVQLLDEPSGEPLGSAALRRLADVIRACSEPDLGGRYVFLPSSDRAAVLADICIALCEAGGLPSDRMVLTRRPEDAAAALGVTSLANEQMA